MKPSIQLTDAQFDALDRLRFSSPSAEVFRNCLIILRSHAGCSIAQIAAFLGCSADTVKRVRRLYRQGGIAALHPRDSPGRTSRATPAFRQQLRCAVKTCPLTLGYGFATWSSARLAEHLAELTGIRFSDDQMRRLLKEEDFSFQRPKHTLKGKRDEAAFQHARQELQARKRQALGPEADFALVFQDEVEVHKLPALTRVWSEVGSQPEVPSPGKNEKRVIYGGIDYLTGKISYTVGLTKSGVNFLAFLVALAAIYVGKKVVLVCDNGRFHTTKAVQAWLEANKDKLEIYWLPPYSPSLNLIERLWGHLKRTVLANVLFQDMEQLEAAARRGLDDINGKRQRMSFVFNHDDVWDQNLKLAG
jgi:putative transposase